MKKWILGIIVIVLLAVGIGWFSLDKETRNLAANMPTNRDVLFWSDSQREAAFRAMDRMPMLAKSNIVEAGDVVFPLPKGEALNIDTDAYMKAQRTAGLVIVHNGKIRLEKYGLDFSGDGKWTSFSVAKSLTSTLVGAAIKDGFIKSIDDNVTVYIPEMKGSAYDDVSIAQLLSMTSGVKWNEDYGDRNSDVARFNEHKPEPGVDATVSYMRTLPREAPAGSKWVYKTGETNLIGVLVSKATKKKLADYLSEKIWSPFGMEQDASWLLGSTGHEISGCCLQASTRDFARFGVFVLGGAKIDGTSIVPDSWIAAATTKKADIGIAGRGYGYQWWTNDDGSYGAQGIFGQGIFIDPKRNLVIASNSNWPSATDETSAKARQEFYAKVQVAVDGERVAR
jgi:CubicO group peptidase (beta-lactamase class C family)